MDSTCIILSFSPINPTESHTNLKKTQLSGDSLLPLPSGKSTGIRTPAQVLQIPKWEITLYKPNGCSLTSWTDSKAQRHSEKWLCSIAFCLPHLPIEKQHKIPSLLSTLALTGKWWGPGCSSWSRAAARALGRAVLLPASLLKPVYLCLP